MRFNSFAFLCFLPVVLVVYCLLPHRAQNWFLLFASCFFYACWDWRFLAPLLLSTSIDYWCATRMEDQVEKGLPIEARKPYLVLSLVTNLGLLGFFKYFNFFTGSFQGVLGQFGVHPSLWTLRIILPIGISFYIFQALSYTIDVYRGQLHATRKFHEFLLAVLYFPQRKPKQEGISAPPAMPPQPSWWHWLKVIGFFQLTALGWLIFRADSFAQLTTMLAALFHPSGFDLPLAWKIFSFALPLIIVQMIQYTTKTLNFVKWSWFTPEVGALTYSIRLYFVPFRGGRPESFIYFQF